MGLQASGANKDVVPFVGSKTSTPGNVMEMKFLCLQHVTASHLHAQTTPTRHSCVQTFLSDRASMHMM